MFCPLRNRTEGQLEDLAEIPAAFVPIQIDLDYKTFKIRDSFVWNVNGMLRVSSTSTSRPYSKVSFRFFAEKLITPDSFARTFCDDLELGPEQVAEVSRQIAEQIDEQAGMAEVPFRSAEEELEMIEKDLRVIINVSCICQPRSQAFGSLLCRTTRSSTFKSELSICEIV